MTAGSILFCPFCRESFEGLAQCPTHGLVLVPLRELPPEHDAARDAELLPRLHPGFGRAWVALGVVLTLMAFFLPAASLSGQMEVTNTMYELARARATRLWLVPLAACAQLVVLHRRRSLAGMRGARLVALIFALIPSGALLSTWLGIDDATASLSARIGAPVRAHLEVGAFLVWLAALPSIHGAWRLGVRPLPRVQQA